MPPKPLRRITVLLMRLGIVGLFLAAVGIALTGFALFGCTNCAEPNGPSRKIEGMTVNPPDPPAPPTAK
jgi:hypothetical protein